MKIYGIQYGLAPKYIINTNNCQNDTSITPLCKTFKEQQNFEVACAYMNAQAINFGYKSILKDLFKEGKMPSVKYGIYGNLIDDSNVSLDHLKPYSMGGRSTLSNFALAHSKANSARGNNPLPYFLNKEMLEAYLSQFNFEIKGKFNGFIYQDMIRHTCRDLGVGDKLKDPKDLLQTSSGLIVPASKIIEIDYGNMKDVIKHLDDIDLSLLSKSMLRSLKNRGYI